MAGIRSLNPVTPGTRGAVKIDRSMLWKGRPEKKLVFGLKSNGGRNNRGVITVRHQGGGHKRSYRKIDFKRSKVDMSAVVQRIEYDPNRSAFIALIKYDDGELSYILAPHKTVVGDVVRSGDKVEVRNGNSMQLSSMPVGSVVHNVELHKGKGGQMARSGGAYAQVVNKDHGYVLLRLPSGETRKVRGECFATVGIVSNLDNKNVVLGKAGRTRWKGIRPSVRGVAMNPIDHPHGGGEGKSSGGRHPVTPWGIATKGKKTRRNTMSDKLIIRRRKS